MDKINELKLEIENIFNGELTLERLNELKVEYLGKKGIITGLNSMIKDLPNEEKKEFGQKVNELRNLFNEKYEDVKVKLETEAINKKLENERIDVTLPETKIMVGAPNVLEKVIEEVEELLMSMGYDVVDGPEIEEDRFNFEMLNIPKDHPARDMQDTYYLNTGNVLRTQTSACQSRFMLDNKPPFRMIAPGRCFRNEAMDASHENTFFQLEGMMVEKDLSIANLVYIMKTLLTEILEREVEVRLRPGFFPFVEPGFELDINCQICGGKGCPTCKHSGWLELLPCGMVHPNVLRAGGIDPDEYTGFAFGLGLTRLAMMKYGIKDIRVLNSGDIRMVGNK